MSEQVDDFLDDDIFGESSYTNVSIGSTEFKPWHRPRKHFVRIHQWGKLLRKILAESDKKDTIRYLGLPGDDLLDIRYFHDEVCMPAERTLSFTAFNTNYTEANVALNTSLQEVHSLRHIGEGNIVIPDDIRQISIPQSMAGINARKFGPYDVINFDLCDHVEKGQPSALDALQRLLTIQARDMKHPWLLLLTTRVNPDNSAGPPSFKKLFLQNLSHEKFRSESVSHLKIGSEEDYDRSIEEFAGYRRLIYVGICKSIFHWTSDCNPRIAVELKSVQVYRVTPDAESEDMISLAFQFTPKVDSLGRNVNLEEIEANMAVKILNYESRKKDVDSILEGDRELLRELIEDTAKYLEKARYDPKAYEEWAYREEEKHSGRLGKPG
jgi:hypothetical protein